MHQTNEQGELVFLCDFCSMPWSESRPMVEGHRGSIICGACLSIAFTEVVHLQSGYEPTKGETCVLCLETGRPDPHWKSPVNENKIACRRCIKQSAGVLKKDPDNDWTKPLDPLRERDD